MAYYRFGGKNPLYKDFDTQVNIREQDICRQIKSINRYINNPRPYSKHEVDFRKSLSERRRTLATKLDHLLAARVIRSL